VHLFEKIYEAALRKQKSEILNFRVANNLRQSRQAQIFYTKFYLVTSVIIIKKQAIYDPLLFLYI